jgi:hypothetical protein
VVLLKNYAEHSLQGYKSQKTAEHIMESSINFPKYAPCEIVEVILEEKKGIG